MRDGGNGATPMGLRSQRAKAVVLLAWTVGQPLLSGLWGGGGFGSVCAFLPDIAARRSPGRQKGAGGPASAWRRRSWPTKCLGARRVPQVRVVGGWQRPGGWAFLGAT